MIFYFSATGNSLYAAKKLAEQEQTECISIAEVINSTKGCYVVQAKENEVIGFVIPVYFNGLPTIVSDFLSKIHFANIHEHYLFLVQTYGVMTGNAASLFQKELNQHGLRLSASYSLCTIDSYLPMFDLPEEKEFTAILQKTEEQLAQICASVGQRRKLRKWIRKGSIGSAFITGIMQRSYRSRRKTSIFTVGTDCTGCGLCERVCPCGTIRIANHKPVWLKETCTLCLGCVHRCPTGAIEYGDKTKGKTRYTNQNIVFPSKYL